MRRLPILLVAGILVLLPRSVWACSCPETFTPPCAAFQRADFVFTGTVTGVPGQSDTASGLPGQSVHFNVERVFKGPESNAVTIDSRVGDCAPKLTVNRKYFVYAHRTPSGRLEINNCDRTRIIEAAGADLEYAGSLQTRPRQSVMGFISLSEENLKNVKVLVTRGAETLEAGVKSNGLFEVDIKEPGDYTVRLAMPFQVKLSSPVGVGPADSSGTSLQYNVSLEKGQCDYREIYVTKRAGAAEISGVAVDERGLPVPGLLLELYPFAQNPDFSNLTQKLARADVEGRYRFKDVAEGRYVIGVNLEETPALSTPYPKTFFPGVPDFHQATVIEIKQGQPLSLGPFQIPPKLVKRKVTGKLIWGDGTPVTKSPSASPNLMQAILYLLSPISLRTVVSFDSEGNKITMDEKGNFSFVGYEGYEYVIHAHALRGKDKPFHSRAVKLKITASPYPLTLVLSEPGTGEEKSVISRELGLEDEAGSRGNPANIQSTRPVRPR